MKSLKLVIFQLVLFTLFVLPAKAGPIIAYTPNRVDFTVVNTGSSGTLYVTVANLGDSDLTLSSSITGTDFASAGTGTCGKVAIAPGTTCTLSIKFAPTSAVARTGTLTLTSNAPGSPNTVTLTGIGGPNSALQDNPLSLKFGTLALGVSSPIQSVTVTNAGNTNLTFTAKTTFSPSDFSSGNTGSCGSGALAPGSSCTLSAKFTPTSSGTRNGTMTISTNSPGSPFVVPLTGIGGSGPNLALDTSSLNFGAVATGTNSNGQTSFTKLVTVKNVGNSDLHFTSRAQLSLSDFQPGGTGTCSTSTPLPAGSTCTLSVKFTPTTTGTRTGTMTIASDAPGSPATVTLSGIGNPQLWPSATHLHVPSQYATIQAAIDAAINGTNTVIHVAPGTYTENLNINKSGVDDTHRFVLVSDQKWEARIVAATTPPQPFHFMVHVEADYVDIIGFEITGGIVGGGVAMSTVRDSPNLPGSFNRLLASYVHDAGSDVACIYTSPGYPPDGIGVTHNTTINGNLVQNCGPISGGNITYDQFIHGIYVTNPYAVVTNNIVVNSSGYGIHLWHAASHDTIANNTVVNGFSGGIMVASEDPGCAQNNVSSIIANNIVAGNRDAIDQTEGTGCHVISPTYTNNVYFKNCQDGTAAKTNVVTGDPNFVVPPAWTDFHAGCPASGKISTVIGEFSITPVSSAIDAANTAYASTIDYSGAPRPIEVSQGRVHLT